MAMGKRLSSTLVPSFILGLTLLVYISGLFVDVNGDAAKYASIGKDILSTGEWLEIKDKGEPYLEKPPYLFWTSALSFRLFGISNFAYKFPVFLLSIAGMYALYRLGRLYYDRQVGLLAAGLMITSLSYMLYHNDIHTDTCLTTWVIIAIWQFAEYLHRKRILHFIAAFSACGLAMLTKGPIGLVIPVFAIGSHLALHRRWKVLFSPVWLAGLPIIGLWLLPYLIGLFKQFNWVGIKFFLWTNNFGRITGSLYENNSDLTYYIHTFLWVFLPWSVIGIAALFMEIRMLIRDHWKLRQGEALAVGAFLCYFPIISVAQFKSPNYLMVVFPLVALITAKWVLKWTPGSKIFRFFSGWHQILFILFGLSTLFLLFYPFPDASIPEIIVAMTGLLAGILIIYKARSPFNRLLCPAAIGILILYFAVNTHLFPAVNQYHTGAVAAKIVNKNILPGERFFTRHRNYNATHFYANVKVEPIREFSELSAIILLPGVWLYTTEEGKRELDSLSFKPLAVILLPHHFLRRPKLKILFPGSRESVMEKRYLIHW